MSPRIKMAIVRPYQPNVAELAIYRAFLDEMEVTVFYTGVNERAWRNQLDALGLERMKAVRYRSYTDFLGSGLVQRGLDFKIGLGSIMLSHLDDVLGHEVINVVDPIYAHVHQIMRRMRQEQRLIIVRWENLWGRYDKIWLAARHAASVLERADAILCVSQTAMKTLQLPAGFGGTVAQVYPGVDCKTAGHAIRKAPPAILFVGRPQWSKGLQCLLAAYLILRGDLRVEADLWIVGIDERAASNVVGEFGITGHVLCFSRLSNVEVRRKMMEASVFCQPSLLTPTWAEQFGFAMVEAMMHGLPVVAFDSGCIREICGSDAVYASAGNALSLAEALASVLSSPALARARGDRLRARARQEFDADVQGRKLLEVVRGVLGIPGFSCSQRRRPEPVLPGS